MRLSVKSFGIENFLGLGRPTEKGFPLPLPNTFMRLDMRGWEWMDTYSLQRLVLKMDLLPTEKLVGMALALHMDRKTGKIRVRQDSIAQECGVSPRTVRRAVASLVAEGIFFSQQTGRSAILVPLGEECGIVDRPPVTYQIGHLCPIRRRKKAPFDLDTSLSTRVEEQSKRDEKRFQREQNERTISDA